MKFSIIVVVSRGVENQDRSGVFESCFKALCAQDFPADAFEVVVVDSGAGLTSEKINTLSKIASGLRVGFTYINPSLGNLGPARARNVGIKAAAAGQTKLKPDYIAFTDDDVLAPKDWLQKLLEGFSRYPDAAGVGGLTLPAKGLAERNIFAGHDQYIYNRYPKAAGPSREVEEHPVFSGNLAYKRQILEEVGGFDESYLPGVYGEDADLKERVVKAGGYLIFSPVVNIHLAAYNFRRFMRQQEGRGAGILKFRKKHQLKIPGRGVIFLRLLSAPVSFFYYLPKTGPNLKLCLLETAGYFFRQAGKLKHYGRLARLYPAPGKVKMLFVDHTPVTGGAQLALLRHLTHLDKEVFAPAAAVSPDCPGFNEKLRRVAGLKVYVLNFPKLKPVSPISVFNLLASALRLTLISRRLDPAVLVANTERAYYACFLVSLLLNKKLILIARDFEYSKKLLSWTKFKVNKYICVSKKIRDFYDFGGDSEVIYVGSDLGPRLEKIGRDQVEENRAKISAWADYTVIGFVGRVVLWKGIFLLLGAVGEILAQGYKIKLVFVGDGEDKNKLVEAARRQNLRPHVHFEDFVDKVELWYKTFDIFAHVSILPEPFATTVIEAALAHLPIVATNTGGTGEFIENGVNGLLIEPSRENLAAALKDLIENKNLGRRLGEAAYQKARQGFTEREITRKFETVYISICHPELVSGSKVRDAEINSA